MPAHRNSRGLPALTRSTRSWTDDDGVHYTVNSFSSPGISFEAMTGNSGGSFTRSFSTSAASRSPAGASLFGNAFSMLEDMIAMQQQQRAAFENSAANDSRKTRRHAVHVDIESETDGDDDGLAYGQYGNSRRKSVFSRIKDRLLDGKRSPRKEDSASGREESPAPSPRMNRRETTYRTDAREPAWSQQHQRPSPVHIVVEHDEDSDDAYSDMQSRKSPIDEHSKLEALANAVDIEKRAVRSCKRRLEQASRQSNVTSSYLQRVIDDMRSHERALAEATDRLNKAKAEQRRTRVPQTQARPRPQTYHPRHSQQRQPEPSLEGHFFPAFAGFGFDPPSPHNQHRDPIFDAYEQLNAFHQFPRPQTFAAYDHLFGDMPSAVHDGPFQFFNMHGPRRSQGQRARQSQGPPPAHHQSHQFPAFTPPPTPPSPQPPASLLRPAEAQRLFKSYNDRWNSLLPTDPAIPYPARGLQASALSARDTIWAPHVNADISTWNEETVMQANAQAFFLAVVGLKPHYTQTPGTGQIECSFEKASASPEQIKQLVDILKKEKPRWHSDRLGRRNGGVMGGLPNEVLQKDVRARAVFHAVVNLMGRAQEQ